MNRLWCPKKLYYIWRFFNTKIAVKRFSCHLMIFFAENYLCEFNHAKIVKFAKLKLSDRDRTSLIPFTTICRSANFTSIKFTHAKWSWIQWFIFGNRRKITFAVVQRIPMTAMKMIFIIGYMAKQHTILSSRFLIWLSKEDQKHWVIKYRVYYLLIYRIFEAWVVCCRSNNLGSNTISWWLRSLAVSKRW